MVTQKELTFKIKSDMLISGLDKKKSHHFTVLNNLMTTLEPKQHFLSHFAVLP